MCCQVYIHDSQCAQQASHSNLQNYCPVIPCASQKRECHRERRSWFAMRSIWLQERESGIPIYLVQRKTWALNFQFVHPLALLLSQSSTEYIQRYNWFRQRIPRFRLWGCNLVNTTSHIRLNGEVTCRSQPAIPPAPDWSFFSPSSSSSSRSLRLV
jgi:hypothetical protein